MCPFLDIVEIFSASSRFLNLNSLIIYIVFISNFVSLATFLLVFIFAPSHYQIPLYFLYFIFYQFSFFSPWQTFHWCDYIFSPPPILLLYFIFYSFSVFFFSQVNFQLVLFDFYSSHTTNPFYISYILYSITLTQSRYKIINYTVKISCGKQIPLYFVYSIFYSFSFFSPW